MNELTRIAAQLDYSEAVKTPLRGEPALFIYGQWVKAGLPIPARLD